MMPEQLWATTLDPARRMLRRLTVQVQTALLFLAGSCGARCSVHRSTSLIKA